ncbi:MAG TPA: serine/threonine-protein kinase [Gemmataceae bacterium]|nr:serine/threonine-protein kinase [Gemmataceae bacterium]
MPAPASTEDFMLMMRQSHLLPAEEIDAYLRKRDGALPPSVADLAEALVRDGLLTHFQAKLLLQGKWRGFLLAGKYKLLEHLGAGGMATVFLCEHVSMQRRVAIKVLPPAQAKDPGAVERFYREARAVATLDHPNIVRAHDIDHDGKVHFLVMEYVEGPSLVDLVRKKGPLPVARACNYVRQAAVGLHHAHLAGLVHRDVKPGNILVDRSGVVKVLDMGLARFFNDHIDDITKRFDDNAALGTVDFLAPEQALDSHTADCRADIYSLGATLYAVLTGRTPFGPGTSMQKMLRHHLQEPAPLCELRPDVPEALAAVVARMMAKSPEARYQTAADVHQALAAWDTEPVCPPADDEVPRLSPRSQGPGSSARGPAFPSLPSGVVLAVSAPASAASSAATPLPAAPAPRPVRAGRDWRGWAIIGATAVLLLSGTVFGLHWALSTQRSPLPGQQGPESPGKKGNPRNSESVTIAPDATTHYVRHIHTPHYDAVLNEDGNLGSLKVADVEFFKTGVPLSPGQPSRGAYLYSDRTGQVVGFQGAETAGNVLTARNGTAVVKMTFSANAVAWTITNATHDDVLYFCILFDRSVTAVWDNAGAWMPVPPPLPEKAPPGYRVDLKWETTSWFAGKAKLTLTGGTETWGPAPTPKEGYQVWQLTVPPGATRQVSGRIDEATAQELAEVAKVEAGPSRRPRRRVRRRAGSGSAPCPTPCEGEA